MPHSQRILDASILAAAAVSLFAGVTSAQGTTFGFQQVISTQADGVLCVDTGDLDGDGDPDLVSASLFDNTVAWYENLGNHSGAFGPMQVISTSAMYAITVHAADLDGDGDVDLLSASALDNKIAWYENFGAANFGSQQVISSAGSSAYDVTSADLDGDGDLDVLACYEGSDEVVWFENLGAASFGSRQLISNLTDRVTSVVAGDLDGDGDLDVVVASGNDDEVSWFENQGAGQFGAQQLISSSSDGAYAVALADFDGDGDLDVVAASEIDGSVVWYANDGLGGFGLGSQLDSSADGANSVDVADLDGDGDVDVLATMPNFDQVAWYENDGGGVFAGPWIISESTNFAAQVVVEDVDGDGGPDVLSASRDDDKVAAYRNHVGTGFTRVESLQAWGVKTMSVSGGMLAYHSTMSGQLFVWQGGELVLIRYVGHNFAVSEIGCQDLDGDGGIDVWYRGLGDEYFWFKRQADGTFLEGAGQYVSSTSLGSFGAVSAGVFLDLDRDGDLDFVYSLSGVWYAEFVSAANGFLPPLPLSPTASETLLAGDLNGDGATDIYLGSAGQGEWLENPSPGGAWVSHPAPPAGEALVDMDFSGSLDLVTSSAWHFNDGVGQFGTPVPVPVGPGEKTAFGDLDHDGLMDVAEAVPGVQPSEAARIVWSSGLIGGGFSPFKLLAVLPDACCPGYTGQILRLCGGDLDCDGDVDLAVSQFRYGTYESGYVAIYSSDWTPIDCDGNGVNDLLELQTGAASDCNQNGVPDICDLSGGGCWTDCNLNNIPDQCEVDADAFLDCDANGVLDVCEPVLDCNGNGLRDSCELLQGLSPDCNSNGIPDDCDLASGASTDCDGDLVPDECQPDCDENGVADTCDIASGTSSDCDGSGVPDSCELAMGELADCDGNGVPDPCDIANTPERDCDGDGLLDSCEITGDAALDCDANGLIDSCEVAGDPSLDLNGNGELDSCECATPSVYCVANPNSVGSGAAISSTGLSSVGLNDFRLSVSQGPPGFYGIFFYGAQQANQVFGDGVRCVGGQIFRLSPAVQFDAGGVASLQVDFTQAPASGGAGELSPGSTWNFQFWYRDPQGGLNGFNLSDGLQVTFCP